MLSIYLINKTFQKLKLNFSKTKLVLTENWTERSWRGGFWEHVLNFRDCMLCVKRLIKDPILWIAEPPSNSVDFSDSWGQTGPVSYTNVPLTWISTVRCLYALGWSSLSSPHRVWVKLLCVGHGVELEGEWNPHSKTRAWCRAIL